MWQLCLDTCHARLDLGDFLGQRVDLAVHRVDLAVYPFPKAGNVFTDSCVRITSFLADLRYFRAQPAERTSGGSRYPEYGQYAGCYRHEPLRDGYTIHDLGHSFPLR